VGRRRSRHVGGWGAVSERSVRASQSGPGRSTATGGPQRVGMVAWVGMQTYWPDADLRGLRVLAAGPAAAVCCWRMRVRSSLAGS
jgi:hypothetical protein